MQTDERKQVAASDPGATGGSALSSVPDPRQARTASVILHAPSSAGIILKSGAVTAWTQMKS